MFWKLNYSYMVDDGDYTQERQGKEIFFEYLEEAMKYIVDHKSSMYISDIHLSRCFLAVWGGKYALSGKENGELDEPPYIKE